MIKVDLSKVDDIIKEALNTEGVIKVQEGNIVTILDGEQRINSEILERIMNKS